MTTSLTHVDGPLPENLRFSTLMRALACDGHDTAAAELERLRVETATRCSKHGALEDPVVFTVGEKVLFCCPWCSEPKILAAWEREGQCS